MDTCSNDQIQHEPMRTVCWSSGVAVVPSSIYHVVLWWERVLRCQNSLLANKHTWNRLLAVDISFVQHVSTEFHKILCFLESEKVVCVRTRLESWWCRRRYWWKKLKNARKSRSSWIHRKTRPKMVDHQLQTKPNVSNRDRNREILCSMCLK